MQLPPGLKFTEWTDEQIQMTLRYALYDEVPTEQMGYPIDTGSGPVSAILLFTKCIDYILMKAGSIFISALYDEAKKRGLKIFDRYNEKEVQGL